MRRAGHIHHAGADLLPPQCGDEFFQGIAIARENRVARTVVHRDPQAILAARYERFDLGRGGPEGGHGAHLGILRHRLVQEAAPLDDDAESIGEGQCDRDVPCRDFPRAMPDNGAGNNTAGFPGFGQGDLEGEKARLRNLDAAVFESRVRVVGAKLGQQRPIGVWPQQFMALLQLGLESGKARARRSMHAAHCPPCPEQTKTTRPAGGYPATLPTLIAGCPLFNRSAASCRHNSSPVRKRKAARWSKWDRRRAAL